MSKLMFVLSALVLAGCASTSDWRALRIDASSESAFEESVALLADELPWKHRQLFGLALADIAITGVQNAAKSGEDGESGYAAQDYRRQLDGLGYDDVISLADQTGPPTLLRYTYGLRAGGRRARDANSYVRPYEYPAATYVGGVRHVYPADSNPWIDFSPPR